MNNLRQNQINAVTNFKSHYYDNSNTRGILSMCCGSGKTRTFYEIIKNCINEHDENLFMYVTSRILLVNGVVTDLIEWMYIENLDIDILIKVSEFNLSNINLEILRRNENNSNFDKNKFNIFFKKIRRNNIKILDNDITDIIKSRYILENKKIIVITTYESIRKVIDAISYCNESDSKQKDIIPNLLICDEAHNLVSSDNDLKIAKKILEEDENTYFFPEKYLFMTATPLKIIKRNSTSSYINNDIIYSMSNENIYGKVFYEYTFYEGIQDNYILDFDTIYLNDMDIIEDSSLIKALEELDCIDDKNQQQHCYFIMISKYLLKVIEKYNLKHILVYLSNQTKVKNLQEILKTIIYDKNLNIETKYIISEQSEIDKRLNKSWFEQYTGNTKILLSVGIFNEGIDIPICDSILFAEERSSETIIAQNIGRALRKYENKNYVKTKAYVILPTKIYMSENSIESAFSSKFKKIRTICDILKEPPTNEPKYFKRKTKGDNKRFLNENEDENIDEKSGLVDEIIEIKEQNSNNNIISDADKIKLDTISDTVVNSLEITSSNNNISNISLDKLKTLVQKEKIINLVNLKKFLEDKCIVIDKPHIYYKSEWICYGDFFFNKVYSYSESRDIIKSFNLNIKSPKEWLDYYNNIIDKAFKIECNDNDLMIYNKIIYIPYDPKTYYLEEWNNNETTGWNKFLDKELENTVGIEIKVDNSSNSLNASSNLANLINNDKEKVMKIYDWNTYIPQKTNINNLKNHLDTNFEIDSDFEIRFRLTTTFNLQHCQINVRPKQLDKKKVPIIIHFTYKIKYDKDIFNNNKITILENKNPMQTSEEMFIFNQEIQKTLDELKIELIEFINNNKNN